MPVYDTVSFDPSKMRCWYSSSPEGDLKIKYDYLRDHKKLMAGDYADWIDDKDGALVACIVLDQWSRKMFRKDARAYASDEKA